jgi:hypothetical protein
MALACLTALLAGGCGSGAKPSSPAGGTLPGAGTRSGAAELRAQLTGLLAQHVRLSGIAAAVGLQRGFGSPEHAAAARAVDADARALGAAIGSAYGQTAGRRFLATWRRGAPLVTAYARGQADQDAKRTARALDGLDRWRTQVAAVLAAANPRLRTTATFRALSPPVAGLASAINDAVEHDPQGPEQLRTAVEETQPVARLIADGTAARLPRSYPGSADTGAAELRTGLTRLLVDHPGLAFQAVAQELWTGRDAKVSRASGAALDANAAALSQIVASAYGQQPGTTFLSLWRKQNTFLLDYAHAQERHDKARAARALGNLDATRSDLGAFFAAFGPELGDSSVKDALTPPLDATTGAIRALVAGSPKAYGRVQDAATLMPHLAGVLAEGIARRYPARFPER